MQPIVKRSLLVVGAPLALAAVIGGSVAFAAAAGGGDSGTTNSPVQQQATPAPSDPGPGGHVGCDHGGDGGGAQSTQSGYSGQI